MCCLKQTHSCGIEDPDILLVNQLRRERQQYATRARPQAFQAQNIDIEGRLPMFRVRAIRLPRKDPEAWILQHLFHIESATFQYQ